MGNQKIVVVFYDRRESIPPEHESKAIGFTHFHQGVTGHERRQGNLHDAILFDMEDNPAEIGYPWNYGRQIVCASLEEALEGADPERTFLYVTA